MGLLLYASFGYSSLKTSQFSFFILVENSLFIIKKYCLKEKLLPEDFLFLLSDEIPFLYSVYFNFCCIEDLLYLWPQIMEGLSVTACRFIYCTPEENWYTQRRQKTLLGLNKEIVSKVCRKKNKLSMSRNQLHQKAAGQNTYAIVP